MQRDVVGGRLDVNGLAGRFHQDDFQRAPGLLRHRAQRLPECVAPGGAAEYGDEGSVAALLRGVGYDPAERPSRVPSASAMKSRNSVSMSVLKWSRA